MSHKRVLHFVVAMCVTAGAAQSTSYVAISDRALADQAPVIVTAAVVAAEPAPDGPAPATDYLIEVDKVIKGYVPGSTVVVRVPGGEAANGLRLVVWGAPRFELGDRALLFLAHHADGSYRVLHLMLGAFLQHRTGAGTVALRDLSQAIEVGGRGRGEPARDFERFAAWLADYVEGVDRAPDYARENGGPEHLASAFSLNRAADGKPLRWFRFDNGQSAAWRSHSAGQPGLSAADSEARFKEAIVAWGKDPASAILFSYSGSTSASGGLVRSDGVNTLLFNDPGDRHLPGTFKCATGGVVAIGAAWASSSTREFRGERYHDVQEGDIITNDGAACFFQSNPSGAAEVFAHELGHTLGLGHSEQPDALMWPKAHNDGRGARLHGDDLAAVSKVYGNGSGVQTPPSPGGSTAPAAPIEFRAIAKSASEVRLSWKDRSSNETEFVVERKVGRVFRVERSVPADNSEVVIGGLTGRRAVTFRICARNSAGASSFLIATVRLPRRG